MWQLRCIATNWWPPNVVQFVSGFVCCAVYNAHACKFNTLATSFGFGDPGILSVTDSLTLLPQFYTYFCCACTETARPTFEFSFKIPISPLHFGDQFPIRYRYFPDRWVYFPAFLAHFHCREQKRIFSSFLSKF